LVFQEGIDLNQGFLEKNGFCSISSEEVGYLDTTLQNFVLDPTRSFSAQEKRVPQKIVLCGEMGKNIVFFFPLETTSPKIIKLLGELVIGFDSHVTFLYRPLFQRILSYWQQTAHSSLSTNPPFWEFVSKFDETGLEIGLWEISNTLLGWEREPWFLEATSLLRHVKEWAKSVNAALLEELEKNEFEPIAHFFHNIMGISAVEQPIAPPSFPFKKPLLVRDTQLLQFLCKNNFTKNNDPREEIIKFCTSGSRCRRSVWSVVGDFFANNSEIMSTLPAKSVDLSSYAPLFEQEDRTFLSEFPPLLGQLTEEETKSEEGGSGFQYFEYDYEQILSMEVPEAFINFLLKGSIAALVKNECAGE